jgi:hypothetical protein
VYIFQINPVFINKVLQSFNKTGDNILTSERKKQPNSKPAEKRERERERERKKESPKTQEKPGERYLVYFILSFAG